MSLLPLADTCSRFLSPLSKSTVGAVLEAAAGIGAAIHDKVGNKAKDVKNLVQQFKNKVKYTMVAETIAPTDMELHSL